MNEEPSGIKRLIYCRLCLAPDNECVPIFTTTAADKEPLKIKIHACVNIQVHEKDKLSSRICHGCISYLNSWQSFKNRCYAAQRKQKRLLGITSSSGYEQQQQQKQQLLQTEKFKNSIGKKPQNHLTEDGDTNNNSNNNNSNHKENDDDDDDVEDDDDDEDGASYIDNIMQSNYFRNNNNINRDDHNKVRKESNFLNLIDLSRVKKEPDDVIELSEGHDYHVPVNVKMEIDPNEYLAQGDEEDEDYMENESHSIATPIVQIDEGPSILTSLGLTHINHVNPFNFLQTEHEYADDLNDDNSLLYTSTQEQPQKKKQAQMPANCSICNMKFSNRANARRHERNIHGVILNPISVQLTNTHTTSTPKLQHNAQHQRAHIDQPEVYDYENPQNYKEYLTEEKISFIKRNKEFLIQYQALTCNCCDRTYPTYKMFMSHMRKRYHSLPRNLCFKCLKQFETKGQFIAHLKKKNCINLYKIYLADDTISKSSSNTNLSITGNDTIRKTKDIISNKVYGCKLCTNTFRLKMEFRNHVYIVHSEFQRNKDANSGACAFCNEEFADPILRRRHYNNLECIVFIVCETCEDRFENHTQYIDHVYSTHLKQPNALGSTSNVDIANMNESSFDQDYSHSSSLTSLRHPQNCPVCGRQYNNYYNVLRHMEVKHPDQLPATYRCEICATGFPRQSELRDHMLAVHGEVVIRKKNFSCKECNASFDAKEHLIDHEKMHGTIHENDDENSSLSDMKKETAEPSDESVKNNLKIKFYTCHICKNSYNTEKGLDEHILVEHGLDKENGLGKEFIKADVTIELKPKPSNNERVQIAGEQKVNNNLNEINELQLKQRECPVCQAVFNVGVAYSNHMRTHTNNNNNTSAIKSGAAAAASSSSHILNESEKGDSLMQHQSQLPVMPKKITHRIRCRLCHKRINTKLGLKRHMLYAHQVKNVKVLNCNLCPAEFNTEKGLTVHMFRAHHVSLKEDLKSDSIPDVSAALAPIVVPPVAVPSQHFECDICHTVYRSKDQLKVHSQTVHGFDNVDEDDTEADVDVTSALELSNGGDSEMPPDTLEIIPVTNDIWFQCRYCNDTFNSRKKLTIHMNSHEEHDQTDYSCKDCGNVYGTRKSLWVHRHKKHPRPPNPICCEICKKIFFDKMELYYHLKTHSQQPPNVPGIKQPPIETQQTVVQHQQFPAGKYSCHVCGQNFQDKGPLSKHLRIHEMQNNMFSTTPIFPALDSNFSLNSSADEVWEYNQTINGDYACDMCPKSFALLSALKVHRGWHFRSPNGRHVVDPQNTWQPDSMPPSKVRRVRHSMGNPPVCPYCRSTFASSNNLRRHIVEVHRRNENKMMRDNTAVNTSAFIERVRECQACQMTFKTSTEWIDHKIMHARTQKPSTTFEWNCEICGKMFTRKERLLQHMITHLNSKEFDEDVPLQIQQQQQKQNQLQQKQQQMLQQQELHFESNSQSSATTSSENSNLLQQRQAQQQQNLQPKIEAEEDDDEDDDDEDEELEEMEQEPSKFANNEDNENTNDNDANDDEDEPMEEEDDGDDDDEDEEEDDAEDEEQNNENIFQEDETSNISDFQTQNSNPSRAYSCDLCQVYFNTAKELRRHVSAHFLNGPVTIVSEENNQTNSPGKQYKCRHCGISYDDYDTMQTCIDSHKIQTNLKCGECQLFFVNDQQVLDHEKLVHPKGLNSNNIAV